MKPRLSIVTINRNNAAGLERTLSGVFSQSFRDFESIVIDGNSTDNSRDVIRRYADRIAYHISEPDTGIYDAMNKGLLQAKADYCLFLNSGDFLYADNTLESVFSRSPAEDIVYFDVLIDYGDTQVLGKMPEHLSYRQFVEHEIWHQALIRRDLFTKYGLYDVSYRLLGDYEFYLRTIIRHKVTTRYMDLTFAVFNTFGVGSRPESRPLAQRERKRAQRENLTFWGYYWKFGIEYFLLMNVIKPVLKAVFGQAGISSLKKLFGMRG